MGGRTNSVDHDLKPETYGGNLYIIMSLGCGGKCAMFFLVLINTLFLLLGLALLVIDIVMRVNAGVLNDTEILKLMNQVDLNGVTMATLVTSLSLVSICLGCFVIVVAVLGSFGACCKVKCMLIVYAVIILLILLAEVAIITLWAAMRNKMESIVISDMTNAFKNYNGPSASDDKTAGWNLLFIRMDCCGVLGPSNDLDEFAITNWASSRSPDKIPYSCCNNSKWDNYASGSDTSCTQSFQKYKSTGCYKAIYNWFNQYSTGAILIAAIILAIECLWNGVCFCTFLLLQKRRNTRIKCITINVRHHELPIVQRKISC